MLKVLFINFVRVLLLCFLCSLIFSFSNKSICYFSHCFFTISCFVHFCTFKIFIKFVFAFLAKFASYWLLNDVTSCCNACYVAMYILIAKNFTVFLYKVCILSHVEAREAPSYFQKKKSNLHYTRDITTKRVPSGVHLSYWSAPGQQRNVAALATLCRFDRSGNRSQTSSADSDVFNYTRPRKSLVLLRRV